MRTFTALAAACALVAGMAFAAEAPPKEGEALEALEQQMAELVNRDRAEHKAPPLIYHRGLAAVGRAHCLDMKTNRFFAHDSPTTGKVLDRVLAAQIMNRGVGENLARGGNIETAEKMLMASPKHKENILSTTFTHVGIGLLRDGDGTLLCTQVFMTAAPVFDPADVQAEIVEGINQVRLAKGLRRLVLDRILSEQALAHSKRAAKLGKADPMWLQNELSARDKRWALHIAGHFLTDKPDDVINSDVAMSRSADHFGVGVVLAPTQGKTAGALWVTLLVAQKK